MPQSKICSMTARKRSLASFWCCECHDRPHQFLVDVELYGLFCTIGMEQIFVQWIKPRTNIRYLFSGLCNEQNLWNFFSRKFVILGSVDNDFREKTQIFRICFVCRQCSKYNRKKITISTNLLSKYHTPVPTGSPIQKIGNIYLPLLLVGTSVKIYYALAVS